MVIIEPAQPFGSAQVADFLARVESASLDDAHSVVVDLKNLPMLESCALGALVAAAKSLAQRSATLELHHLSDELQQLFADTAINRFFDIMLKDATVEPASVLLFAPCENIKLDIERLSVAAVCILRLRGLMNHPAGSRFFHQQFLLNLLNYRHFLLDFDQLTFFDSLCVGELLALHDLLQKTGGSMRIAGCNFLISELFTTLSIDRIIPMYSTRDEALRDWDAAHD
jgi:anti-anti-sigma factor